jgi:hypothetical protein
MTDSNILDKLLAGVLEPPARRSSHQEKRKAKRSVIQQLDDLLSIGTQSEPVSEDNVWEPVSNVVILSRSHCTCCGFEGEATSAGPFIRYRKVHGKGARTKLYKLELAFLPCRSLPGEFIETSREVAFCHKCLPNLLPSIRDPFTPGDEVALDSTSGWPTQLPFFCEELSPTVEKPSASESPSRSDIEDKEADELVNAILTVAGEITRRKMEDE